jgi:hypothetical protein
MANATSDCFWEGVAEVEPRPDGADWFSTLWFIRLGSSDSAYLVLAGKMLAASCELIVEKAIIGHAVPADNESRPELARLRQQRTWREAIWYF